MYRQPSSRNQRSNGVKVKYAVQICLLLAVSFWLIYQVKHSHDKKKEFDETEVKASPHMHSGKNYILGRKGINAQDEETTSVIGDTLHKSIEEEENVEEGDEENKPEEDEHIPEEDEHEEKDIDHEHENLDASENEAREVDSGGNKSDENDHNGNVNDNKSTHEARDENYKADDASSAVTHEARMGTDENVNEHTENSREHPEISVLEDDSEEVSKDSEVEGGEIVNVDQKANLMISEANVESLDSSENLMISEANVESLDSSENGSPPNDTLIIENHELLEPKPELDQGSQATGFDTNSTDSAETKDIELQQYEDFSNSSDNNTVTLSSDSSVGSGNTTESSSETEDEVEAEKSDLNDGIDENSKSPVTENPEEDNIDEFDASESLEEKHIRTDLDTLPEIQTEGANNDDDVAAE